MHEPELNVVVEVRDFGAYLHGKSLRGAGGIPVGSSGKAMLLISGGIDSPVAGYMMAKRGVSLSAVHFMSPPYTCLLYTSLTPARWPTTKTRALSAAG